MSLPALTPATVIVQGADIVEVNVAGALVLYEPSGDRFVRLNQTAAELWHALAAPIALAELARSLIEAHGIEALAAARDAETCVASLLTREMVTVSGPGS